MYVMYEEQCRDLSRTPIKKWLYEEIFQTELNLSFHHPKKDLCDLCEKYKVTEETDELKKQYESYMQRKEESRLHKSNDKKNAQSDPSHVLVTFDREKVFSCWAKQKNCINAGMFLQFLANQSTTIETITQKFMESGHSQMEVDTVHSTVERLGSVNKVYSPHDWYAIVQSWRSSQPYEVIEMTFKDFKDHKTPSLALFKNKNKADDDFQNSKRQLSLDSRPEKREATPGSHFTKWPPPTTSGRANCGKALSIDAGLSASQFKEFVRGQFPALVFESHELTPGQTFSELNTPKHDDKHGHECEPFSVGSPAQLSGNDTAHKQFGPFEKSGPE
ncbi:hypothetical protein CAPTEDRAFT_191861 [Capitella teleta]|uniref:Uncharacterized protein n=1 Tax=Capitella teleta TaxID=283909 RepID=R7TY42_CAPTE|nr:hypothetical protein CAPTEDRAFT_191861 [Capitella teleta]|eukprot:ELT98803.1 hypothetical protein CAPTEDRAFT_191861 [Capitella teleta]